MDIIVDLINNQLYDSAILALSSAVLDNNSMSLFSLIQNNYAFGLCYAKKGNFSQAITYYEDALSFFKQMHSNSNNTNQSNICKEQWPFPKLAYSPDISNQMTYEDACLEYINILISCGNISHANKILQELETRGSNSFKFETLSGLISVKLGDCKQASRHYMNALKINPSALEIRMILGKLNLDPQNEKCDITKQTQSNDQQTYIDNIVNITSRISQCFRLLHEGSISDVRREIKSIHSAHFNRRFFTSNIETQNISRNSGYKSAMIIDRYSDLQQQQSFTSYNNHIQSSQTHQFITTCSSGCIICSQLTYIECICQWASGSSADVRNKLRKEIMSDVTHPDQFSQQKKQRKQLMKKRMRRQIAQTTAWLLSYCNSLQNSPALQFGLAAVLAVPLMRGFTLHLLKDDKQNENSKIKAKVKEYNKINKKFSWLARIIEVVAINAYRQIVGACHGTEPFTVHLCFYLITQILLPSYSQKTNQNNNNSNESSKINTFNQTLISGTQSPHIELRLILQDALTVKMSLLRLILHRLEFSSLLRVRIMSFREGMKEKQKEKIQLK
ncbi:MAG: hypothetical protein EZS28_009840 [Streblomastix strix]|uniref:Tetratricopeptide repeat protein n=1 Tax=Streblomastix strix TaxID=222440 RepID=A0A5J4WIT3_9EUKA|nr:MAG: hypothetical protein EZS28_009840 [Streblomastix strix]